MLSFEYSLKILCIESSRNRTMGFKSRSSLCCFLGVFLYVLFDDQIEKHHHTSHF